MTSLDSHHQTWRRFLALLMAVFLCLAADVLATEDAETWSEPYPGVRYLTAERTEGPNRIHALFIDLDHPAPSFTVNRPEDRGMEASEFAEAYDVEIAVNGGFYDVANHNPIGLTMGEGAFWEDSRDYKSYGYVAFGDGNRVEISTPAEILDEPEPWMQHIVSGTPLLIEDGEIIVEDGGNNLARKHPRTAIGLDEDGRTLILVVVDGRWPGQSHGMSLTELADLMKDLGAHRALNLDGGGSTTLYIRNADGVVNRPSGGSERAVSNLLGVRIDTNQED